MQPLTLLPPRRIRLTALLSAVLLAATGCSSTYPVSRAVTASSAVPVLFPPIVLKNHADECDISKTRKWAILQKEKPDSYSQSKLIEGIVSYRDADNRAYINLIDGGISDNLGLRAMIDRA